MVSAARFNYVLFVAMGVFWTLSGLYYLAIGTSGFYEFTVFGIHAGNAHVVMGVLEVVFGLFWLYIITNRYDGEVSFRS